MQVKFLNCGTTPLGIYPIVDRSDKLETLYRCGITTAQLRIKDKQSKELEEEILEGIKISQKYNVRFFINDYWELAIKYGAYGVHLGQEDILDTDIDAIKKAKLRLGISTHTPEEIKIAMSITPSYLAIGQIFETTSKKMKYNPVGIKNLKKWAKIIPSPIVAIGGINIDNIEMVLETKSVSGVAMISGLLENGNVSQKKTKELVAIYRRWVN